MSMEESELRQYSSLVKSIRVDHPGYLAVLRALKNALESVGDTATPVCLHLAGEYRTGKSCVIEDFLALYPAGRRPDGLRRLIVYATVPHDATVKGLVEALLRAFGDPHWARGSTSKQTARLLDYLEKTGCRMIVLDEFQHLCDKGQKKQLDKTTDWIKNLIEKKPWALVAAGLPESASVINRNRQLQGRFDATITMPLFDWRGTDSRMQFRAIVRSFVAELHPFELPDLGGEELGLRVFLATSGRVGLLAKLMDRAIRDAIRKGATKIRLSDLAEAFERAIWFAPRFPLPEGPFLCDLDQAQSDLMAGVLALAGEGEAYWEPGGQVQLQGVDLKVAHVHEATSRPTRRKRASAAKEELRRVL